MKQSRSRAHLTLARENSAASLTSREVIGVDALTDQQKTVAKHLIHRANCTGVLVAALAGEESWETRPLVLINGKLCILRFSDPGSALNRNKMNYIRALYAQLGAHKDINKSAIAVGQSDGQIWTLRRFHQSTYENLNPKESNTASMHPVHRAQSLIALISSLQSVGIIHGHLSLSNIGADEEQPMLLDFGFGGIEAHGLNLAPEIKNGLPPSLASDIYGLGKILEALLKHEESPEIHTIIKQMVADDPSDRPQIEAVKKAFLVKNSENKSAALGKSPMNSGKVLGRISKPLPVTEVPTQNNLHNPDSVIESTAVIGEESKPDSTNNQRIERKPTEILKLEPTPNIISTQASEATPLSEAPKIEATPTSTRARNFTTLIKTATPIKGPTRNLTATVVPSATPQRVKARAQINEEQTYEEPAKNQPGRAKNNNLIVALCLVIFMGLGATAVTFAVKYSKQISQPIDLESYWQSGQLKLQSQVVEEAVKKNSIKAQNIIIESIKSNKKIDNIRYDLLKVGFSKLWADSYSDNDRKILFGLSLEKPPSEILKILPNINSAHSGVIISIASQIREKRDSKIGELPLSAYADLPKPFNTAFAALEIFGTQQIGEPSALGLARIITGNISQNSLSLLLGDKPAGKVGILKILSDQLGEKFAENIILLNSKLGSGGLPELAWFHQSKSINWSNIPDVQKINLASGLNDLSNISLDHKLDLLTFPIIEIREAAAEQLKSDLDPTIAPILNIAASESNRLNRTQTVALLSTLSYQGEHSKKFTMDWFNTSPDPQTVLDILLARNSKETSDFFNLQAARYLADKNWTADFSKLKALAFHYEQVARALAYARLDPNKKEQLLFLRKMSNLESVNSIRKGILNKLKPFNAKSAVMVQPIED